MNITGIDHLVLTVRDIEATIDFYTRILGMRHVIFDDTYHALEFGSQKINLHPYRSEYLPHADITVPGTGDLCLISSESIEAICSDLNSTNTQIEYGPVEQTGAIGPMMSVYIRDPDMNLVEIASYG